MFPDRDRTVGGGTSPPIRIRLYNNDVRLRQTDFIRPIGDGWGTAYHWPAGSPRSSPCSGPHCLNCATGEEAFFIVYVPAQLYMGETSPRVHSWKPIVWALPDELFYIRTHPKLLTANWSITLSGKPSHRFLCKPVSPDFPAVPPPLPPFSVRAFMAKVWKVHVDQLVTVTPSGEIVPPASSPSSGHANTVLEPPPRPVYDDFDPNVVPFARPIPGHETRTSKPKEGGHAS